MAPHPGQEADYIRDKAKKSLLNLLEGVRPEPAASTLADTPVHVLTCTGSRQEKPRH